MTALYFTGVACALMLGSAWLAAEREHFTPRDPWLLAWAFLWPVMLLWFATGFVAAAAQHEPGADG